MVTVKNLTVKYASNVVLDDISFNIKSGDYLAIVGENGSGKSTLLKAMLGLKDYSGTIDFGNIKDIAYLPQFDESLENFPAKVYEIVSLGLVNKIKFFFNKNHRQEIDRILKKMNIYDIKNSYFGALSGGQRQRVLLARALVSNSDILFLDEPTTGLDPMATEDFYSTIDALNHEGMTIVMVTHDISTCIRCAKSVLHLDRGILFNGSKEDYIKTDLFKLISGVHTHA